MPKSIAVKPILGRKGNKPRRSRDKKFEKLLKLLNIHIGLHLVDNVREYITVMNSNILAGELKYKYITYLSYNRYY